MTSITRSSPRWFAALLLIASMLAACDLRLNPSSLPTNVVDLPFGQSQVSFNEISYDARIQKVIVPAAETGDLALVDPLTNKSQLVGGFSSRNDQKGTASQVGAVSAVVAKGMLFALDQAARKINIVDPDTRNTIGSAGTESRPQYIRFVSATNEIWVTEPDAHQIEVFKLTAGQPPGLQKSAPIDVPGGPEGLLIDRLRGLAFTNLPDSGTTAVILVITHNISFRWGNGCSKARGMAIDENQGFLFVACNEGKVVLMDIEQNGAQITSQNYGGNLNNIAYNAQKKHLYVPSDVSAIVAIFEVIETYKIPTPTISRKATPTKRGAVAATPLPPSKYTIRRLGTADTALSASCITSDDQNNIWVCDPNKGRLFLIHDSFPATQ